MARRSEHSQTEIKEMVLEAAEDIVREYGYSALKVRKIAADIGYTVGSIYMVFTNMNDLIMHIKARTWQKLHQHLQEQQKTRGTVQGLALGYLEFAVENEGLWRMLFEHQAALGERTPDWYLQDNQRVFELMYAMLKQHDQLHADDQLQLTTQALMNSVQGIAMQLLMLNQSPETIKLAKAEIVLLVECFLQGWNNVIKGQK
jgi:AcrR family transcriptional regulator